VPRELLDAEGPQSGEFRDRRQATNGPSQVGEHAGLPLEREQLNRIVADMSCATSTLSIGSPFDHIRAWVSKMTHAGIDPRNGARVRACLCTGPLRAAAGIRPVVRGRDPDRLAGRRGPRWRVAAADGERPPEDPEAWYRQRFDREPNYSELLDLLARTREERSQLLRSFLEPTEDERAEG
jgi:hypothetical protein